MRKSKRTKGESRRHKLERRQTHECGNKVRYEDGKVAKVHASLAHLRTGRHIDAYYCRFCEGYHIGHAPRKPKGAKQ